MHPSHLGFAHAYLPAHGLHPARQPDNDGVARDVVEACRQDDARQDIGSQVPHKRGRDDGDEVPGWAGMAGPTRS
jgi:hypothetical protein